ncbi:GyrI-like domain-containing protein [Vibrio amylolyticus]|uniref:AraC family transcriptional regulator n=1 Tax=Vibrio amylolyticus TaxID=2847292 RepID=UPI00355335F8
MPSPNATSSWKTYQDRIRPVLDYVHQNLDQPLTLEKAAAISHFSKYHFQRIFSVMIGESLVQYTNRLRLERAANLLLFSQNSSVTDIAMTLGFSSSTNFTRAFKEHFGVSPVQVKKGKSISDLSQNPTQQYNMDKMALGHVHTMKNQEPQPDSIIHPSRIIHQPNQPLCILRSERGYQLSSIFQCWDDLMQWSIENKIDDKEGAIFALCHDNPIFTPTEKCRYDAAIVIGEELINQIQEPFQLGELEGGKYAVFHYKGSPQEIQKFHLSLYAKWLPYSGYEPDGFPLLEHYYQPFSEAQLDENHRPMELDIEIRLKVKPLNKVKPLKKMTG